MEIYNGATPTPSGYPVALAQFSLFGGSAAGNATLGNKYTYLFNSQLEAGVGGGAQASGTGTSGAIGSCAGAYTAMDVAELLVYSQPLSGPDNAALLAYAKAKYPQLAPTFNAQVFAYGNSITAGYGITDGGTWPIDLQNSLSASTAVYNMGYPAAQTSDLTTNYATTIAPFYSATKTNVLVIWEIRNSICNSGQTAAATYDSLVSLAQAAHTTGFKVIIATSPGSGGCSGQNLTDIATVNSNIKANFLSSGYADAVVDLAANSCLSGTSGSCLQGDGVHLNDAGQAIAAGLIKAALNSIGVQ